MGFFQSILTCGGFIFNIFSYLGHLFMVPLNNFTNLSGTFTFVNIFTNQTITGGYLHLWQKLGYPLLSTGLDLVKTLCDSSITLMSTVLTFLGIPSNIPFGFGLLIFIGLFTLAVVVIGGAIMIIFNTIKGIL